MVAKKKSRAYWRRRQDEPARIATAFKPDHALYNWQHHIHLVPVNGACVTASIHASVSGAVVKHILAIQHGRYMIQRVVIPCRRWFLFDVVLSTLLELCIAVVSSVSPDVT